MAHPPVHKAEYQVQALNSFAVEYAIWDKKLNLVYQHVLRGLRIFEYWPGRKEVAAIDEPNLNKVISEERATVIASEKAWLRFRDADTDAITTLMLARRGSSPATWVAINAKRLDLVKQRVSQLKKYDASLYNSSDTDQGIENDTPTDRWLNKTMDKAEGLEEQFNVVDTAEKRWDRELNRIYRKILHGCNAWERAALVAAEKAWLSYRDKEGKTIEVIYEDHGSPEDDDGNWVWIAQVKMYLIKYRALQLHRLDAQLNPRRVRSK